MSSPLDPSDDERIPPYTPPAWYTAPLPADSAADGASIPWHAVGSGPPPEPGCHICQAQPVAYTQIRSHTGLIFRSRTRTVDEPMCRQCGIATVRTMTAKTLCQGWWSPLSLLFHTPAALTQNADAYRQFRALPDSAPPPGRSSMALGKPVLRRPQAYVALVPLAGAAALIAQIATR